MAAFVLERCLNRNKGLVPENRPVLLITADVGKHCCLVMTIMGKQAAVIRQIKTETGEDIAVGRLSRPITP